MKKMMGAVAVALVASGALTGCAGLAYSNRPVIGSIGVYADTAGNEKVTDNGVGTKKGEACSSSILGIVTTGDASVASAAKAGGITKVGSVDNTFSNILGIYAHYCVEVSGE